MIGTSLSHYRITEKLGQGGMGEVYRTEDTNLSRQVAIQVVPEGFAAGQGCAQEPNPATRLRLRHRWRS